MIPPTTMNLLPKIEVSREIPERKVNGSDQTIKSMDLFPPRAGFMPSVTMEDAQKIADLRYGTETPVFTPKIPVMSGLFWPG